MKRFFISLLFTISVAISFAQAKSDSLRHLSFKGVPIDGTLTVFVSRMKQSGFDIISTADGIALLDGDFASYKNCLLKVSTLKQKDLVSKIEILFPDCKTWSSLSSNYFNLKELLTEKYGKPSESKEKFLSSTPEGDDSKLIRVKLGECKYYTAYEIESGTIQLSIERDGVRRCFVELTYSDKINGETVKKQALDDL